MHTRKGTHAHHDKSVIDQNRAAVMTLGAQRESWSGNIETGGVNPQGQVDCGLVWLWCPCLVDGSSGSHVSVWLMGLVWLWRQHILSRCKYVVGGLVWAYAAWALWMWCQYMVDGSLVAVVSECMPGGFCVAVVSVYVCWILCGCGARVWLLGPVWL